MGILVENYLDTIRLECEPRCTMDRHILGQGMWEPWNILTIDRFVKPGMLCIDIGANSGILTLPMAARAGAEGTVLAFEPSSHIYDRLIRNLSLNPDLSSRVQPIKMAVGSTHGRLKVFQGGDENNVDNAYVAEQMNPKLWNRFGENDFEECEVITLDSLDLARPPGFIKIDVEGMEIEVLKGAENTIRNHHPVIVFETLPEDFDPAAVKACEWLLRSADYCMFFFEPEIRKLRPVTFPRLGPDTLALHRSLIPEVESLIG